MRVTLHRRQTCEVKVMQIMQLSWSKVRLSVYANWKAAKPKLNWTSLTLFHAVLNILDIFCSHRPAFDTNRRVSESEACFLKIEKCPILKKCMIEIWFSWCTILYIPIVTLDNRGFWCFVPVMILVFHIEHLLKTYMNLWSFATGANLKAN